MELDSFFRCGFGHANSSLIYERGIACRVGLFLALTILLASYAHATAQILFTNDKAVVLVQGPAGDLDAPNLYEVMNAPVVDDGTSLKKQINFINSSNQNIFDLSCKVSKTVANLGSCTLVIFKVDGMIFEPANKNVIVAVEDMNDVIKVSQLFVRPDQYGELYFSDDLHLGLSLHYNGSSYPQLFMISYSEKHP